MPSGSFVAKRFFTIGGDEPVTCDRNKDEIKAELVRIAQLQWFFDHFKSYANEKDIEIATSMFPFLECEHLILRTSQDIDIVTAYIGIEVGNSPTEASGALGSVNGEEVWWLIEPRRSTEVIKFSGTMSHPSYHPDLRGYTMEAFTHFVYIESNQLLVMADLQGMISSINRILD